ncbi:putative ATP-dependent RNA helicase YLR419W [Monosporozyma unispora]|nr:hypothetical protein C6P44_004334 [Kazachstania unispora]
MAKKGKKSSSPAVSKQDESSSKKKGKKSKNAKEEPVDPKAEQRAKQQAQRAKVTSTSSWTGKLPHTLLHEFCQKRKWNKVEYDMKRMGEKGMLAVAVLSYTDPKTKEVLHVRMNDPTYDKIKREGVSEPQETPNEARHFAATVALCRIAYNTNLHMMLPPNHKTIWYALDDYRKKLISDGDTYHAERIFNSEPFTMLLEDRKLQQQKQKEREAKVNQQEKEQKTTIVISSTEIQTSNKSHKSGHKDHSKIKVGKPAQAKKSSAMEKVSSRHVTRFPRKIWERAAFIDLDESTRQLIESSLKSQIDWTSLHVSGEMDSIEREILKEKLLSFHFREAHVKEAMKYRDPLSFLLFNLPEDDLPVFFHKRKEDTKNKVEISSLPLVTRMIVDRLSECGASEDEVLFALQQCGMNENEAARILTESVNPQCKKLPKADNTAETESIECWNQELESLQSIYEDSIESIVPDSNYTMVLDVKLKLKLKIYRTRNYPNSLPGIIVSTFDKTYKLPNYIKQQIMTKLLDYIIENSFVGDMMVYTIFEWLQDNIKNIINNPGPLLSEKDIYNFSFAKKEGSIKGDKNFNRSRSSRNAHLSPEQLKIAQEQYTERIKSKEFQGMQLVRSQLPAWQMQDKIVDLIEKNDAVLITGETGSGKSTQVVQFLLDSLMKHSKTTNIICTQPRRISAIGLAERVSDERCVECGDEVGYVIRGVNKTKKNTRIKFMTTGVLVRILQSDKTLLNNSIVVIDEVHERSLDTDLVVTLLKNLMGKIPDLKIVLMSATVNVDLFKNYFPKLATCHITGRTFPIKDFFLDDILKDLNFTIKKKSNTKNNNFYVDDGDDDDDSVADGQYVQPDADSFYFKSGQINYDLLCDVAAHVDQQLEKANNDGSIIIFLPGIAEIDKCCKLLRSLKSENDLVVLPLHSALTPEDQKRVFRRYPRKRKVVVSTNIAETSITIDDCVATIDTGRAKTMYYNPNDNTTRLIESFISKAEAKQRRGRAGRVREGLSYKLFSKRLYEEDMVEMPTPEIKRVALESLYISVKAMGVKNVTKFLASGLECPPLKALKKAERMLTTVGLLDSEDFALTELGRFISLMPVMDSKHGKLLIYSILFGITDVGILTASLLSIGGLPFISGMENRDKIKKILSQYKTKGDVLAAVQIIREYLQIDDRVKRRQFMKDNLLSYNRMNDIMSSRVQYYSILKDIGFLPFNYKPGESIEFNRNQHNIELVEAILTGAYYPNVARVELPDAKYLATASGAIEKDPEAKAIKYWIRNEEYVDKIFELNKDDKKPFPQQDEENKTFPSTRAFIHPSSILFHSNSVDLEEIKSLEEMSDINEKYTNKNPMLKFPFVLYNSSHFTSKLFLREITPTSTLSLLLFGGPITYDINGDNHSPGIVVDDWLPVRTWCKNAVLIKQLRLQLDQAIKIQLENPSYSRSSSNNNNDSSDELLKTVETIISSEANM